MLDSGTYLVLPVTPYPIFNFFFTMQVLFGILAWGSGVVFKLISRTWFIFAIVLLMSPGQVEAEIFDCGESSTMMIEHPNKNGDYLEIDGQEFAQDGIVYQTFECSGLVDIDCGDGNDFRVVIVPKPSSQLFNETFLLGLSGLCAGLMFAFVLAQNTG